LKRKLDKRELFPDYFTDHFCVVRALYEEKVKCTQALLLPSMEVIIPAIFTVTFSHLHYNVFERGCGAMSGSFGVSARNCLITTFKLQRTKVNCEKGYSDWLVACKPSNDYL